MSALERRVSKVERQNGRCRTAYAWRELGETAELAVERHLADRPEDTAAELVVFSWAE